ncbi:hypothetical protein SARC_15407 [Sphaeroforma arctica JP610]|uniref:Uncharacterized protein n=1 Tax=Sphaeroforma arctica JP610 TaxID=667725 RepID=A0A0L0F5P6_9EUKA|nr:hypothetical protein SARC_15407 [Sphaeroforma arctica JP610]KNC72042.1 hypothetical protein SARC_15407 [Sphaeroforma arctica JP610]|eukprot:XP_014145944.1 hypothetical protein SARC_15407 [Sphaeroforma arctica JP610]
MDHATPTQSLKVSSRHTPPPMWAYGLALLFFVFMIGLTYAFVYWTKYNLRVMRQAHAEGLQMRGSQSGGGHSGGLSVGVTGRGRRFAHEPAAECVGEIAGGDPDEEEEVQLVNDVGTNSQHITKSDKGKNYELLE